MIRYLITDPYYYGDTANELAQRLSDAITLYQPDWVLYRDKQTPAYEALAQIAIRTAKDLGVEQILVQSSAQVALKLGATGVHLRSSHLHAIQSVNALGLLSVASTHNTDEIKRSMEANYITYSPIYASPNKGVPKGLDDLNEKAVRMPGRVIALGGITSDEQVAAIKNAGAAGFASIRYFTRSRNV